MARFVAAIVTVVLAGCASAEAPSAHDGVPPPDATPPACVAAAETCNARDDDCDGEVDEDFGAGLPCDGPDADTCADGVLACAGPTEVVCTDDLTSAPPPEVCGNGLDEDCDGADVPCPANDEPAGAIDISAGGQFTAMLAAAHDDNAPPMAGCGDPGGRDVFYQFVLPEAEVVYYDTFGSDFDSVVRVFAGSCAALGAIIQCSDDACGEQRSQGAVQLGAGTYCLVVDQFKGANTTGGLTLRFVRGRRTGFALTGASGTVTGTTTGSANLSSASCEVNSGQPDVGHYFVTCPGTTTVSANTCTNTPFDSILYLRTGSATSPDLACDDDSCGTFDARIQQPVTGANLGWLIVDGFGTTGNGAYTLSYMLQ